MWSPRRFLLALAAICGACAAPFEGNDPPRMSMLTLRAGSLDVSFREINLVAGDSLILRATVESDPEAYQTPVITATNGSALIPRPDGSAEVRIPVFLDVTATAAPKANFASRPALTTKAKLTLACTAEGRLAVWLTLRDATTGVAPTGPGNVRLRVTGDAFADSIAGPIGEIGWGTGMERVGTYSVAIDADSYQPWRQDSIVVTRGLCHIYSQRITAMLIRR